eukprot:Skav231711  [mRNA]  locus=scaffold1306:254871:262207:+ [translate_table: standard]
MIGSGKAPDVCACRLCLALSRLRREGHHPELPEEFGGYLVGRVRELYSEVLDRLEGQGQAVRVAPPVAAGEEPPKPPAEEPPTKEEAAKEGDEKKVKSEEPDFDGEAVADVSAEELPEDKGTEEKEAVEQEEKGERQPEAPEREATEAGEKEPQGEERITDPKEKRKSKKEKKAKKEKQTKAEESKRKPTPEKAASSKAPSYSRESSGRARSSGKARPLPSRKRQRSDSREEEGRKKKKEVEEKAKRRDKSSSRGGRGASEKRRSTKEAETRKKRRRSRSSSPREEADTQIRLEENPDLRRPREPDHSPPAHLRRQGHGGVTSEGDWGSGSTWDTGPPGYGGGEDRWYRKSKGREERINTRRRLGTLKQLTVQPSTRVRYDRALQKFFNYLKEHQLTLPSQKHLLDGVASDYIEHLWSTGEGRALASDTLAAIQDAQPQVRGSLPGTWRLLKTWNTTELPNRAPPMPLEILEALVGYATFKNQPLMALSLLLGFHGLLRTGEILGLAKKDFSVTHNSSSVIISLGLTKTGQRQGALESVKISDVDITRRVKQWLSSAPSSANLTGSPSQWRAAFNSMLTALNFDTLELRPYSLRRGGATFQFRQHGSLDRLLLHGRWLAAKSARLYINEGLAVLTALQVPWNPFSRNLRSQYLNSLSRPLPKLEPLQSRAGGVGKRRKSKKRSEKKKSQRRKR